MMDRDYGKKDDDANARCSRGLKILSVKVRDIVFQKRETTYKEVAESLINDTSFELNFLPGVRESVLILEE
jgi:hypothetical protein